MGSVANIKVEPVTVTWDSDDLGFCDGDITVSFEEQLVDVTAHQTGTNILDAIRTGTKVELTVTLKETSAAQLQAIFAGSSSTYTPTGQGATAVAAWGMDKDFTSISTDCAELVLHPVTATDKTRDLTFWLAYPAIDSLVFSGENPQTVSVTFRVFPDMTKVAEAQYGVYGDGSQDFDLPVGP